MRAIFVLLSALSLWGCPDPVTAVEDNQENASQDEMKAGPGNMETDPNKARMKVNPGEGVMVKGTFNYKGDATGQKKIDTLKPVEGRGPSLVHVEELQDGNDFSIEFPKNYGKVMLKGIIDKTGNGPSADDPQGTVTLQIEETPIDGVTLDVKDDNPGAQPQNQNQANGDSKEKIVNPAPSTTESAPAAAAKESQNPEPPASAGGPPTDD